MMKILNLLNEHLEEWLLVGILGVMSVLALLQVILRDCFHSSIM